MQKLYTKHYKSQILNTKKVKLNNITYIGFNINDTAGDVLPIPKLSNNCC